MQWKMYPANKTIYKCCVLECDSVTGSGISFHSFPKNQALRDKWKDTIETVNCKPLAITTKTFVCRLYFVDAQFNGRVLDNFAEPTTFKKWAYKYWRFSKQFKLVDLFNLQRISKHIMDCCVIPISHMFSNQQTLTLF